MAARKPKSPSALDEVVVGTPALPSYSEVACYLEYYKPVLELGPGKLAIYGLPDRRCFASIDAQEIARKAIEWASRRLDAYLHISTHDLLDGESQLHRGGKDSARAAIGLFSDIDARGPRRKKPPEDLCPTQDDAIWVAEEFARRCAPLRPSFIITSGHGCYPALLLREPFVIEGPDDLQKLETLGRRYHNALHAIGCERGWKGAVDYCDAAKVLRLPGTVNWKDPQDPRPVCLTRENDARFNLSELEEMLPPLAESRTLFTATVSGHNGHADPAAPFVAGEPAPVAVSVVVKPSGQLPEHWIAALREAHPLFGPTWDYERTDLADQSCSGYDMSLANIGVSLGLENQQIADLLVENRRRFPRERQDRKGASYTKYVERTIARAHAGQREPDAVDNDLDLDVLEATEAEPGESEAEWELVADCVVPSDKDETHRDHPPTTDEDGTVPRTVASGAGNTSTTAETKRADNDASAGPADPSITDMPAPGASCAGDSTRHTKHAPSRPKDGIVKKLADHLMSRYHFARDIGEHLYVYRDGIYNDGDLFVREQTQITLERGGRSGSWSSHRGREVVQYIMLRAPNLWEEPPLDEVNLKNGILNVTTGVLRAHSPNFLSPIQIPVVFDPAAACPAWQKFIGEVFPADSRELAWEILGDLITPDRSIQKAILLTGEGGNGKGVFLAGCIGFVGQRNVSAVPLHKLEEDRFSASRLYGKLVNCCADLPSAHLKSTSMFKALTGGDIITAERKYENSFEFKPYARLLFSANHPPRSDDASKAFFDRWVVVPFAGLFRGTKREVSRGTLDAMLADPKELSGVLNKALPALRRVRQLGRFTETETTRNAMAEFQQVTDPLAVWLERETVTHANASVKCSSLLAAYNAECGSRGRPPMTQTAFGASIRRLRPGVDVRKRGPKGEQKDCYIGIGLKADTSNPQEGA